MDAETDLFVQAFWVKCRETIRPELDGAQHRLRDAGHAAEISTLEFSPDQETSPDGAPALVLTVRRAGASDALTLRFRGDVPAREIEITASGATSQRVDMAAVDEAMVRREVSACFGTLLKG